VFSAIASTVGSMAGMEAIKLLAGFGEPLAGKLIAFDLRDMSFHTLPIKRRVGCPVCGSLFE
jgi:molybdopterin/thiamine biosynthesis adenylyltransferase